MRKLLWSLAVVLALAFIAGSFVIRHERPGADEQFDYVGQSAAPARVGQAWGSDSRVVVGAILPPSPSARQEVDTDTVKQMPPEQAFLLANEAARCFAIGVSSENEPDHLTLAQKRQLEVSREGLDCENVSQYSIYALAERAAASGNVQAQLDFSALAALEFNDERSAMDAELIKQYKANSLKYLNLAARAGSSEALQRLSNVYDVGLLTKRDPVKAYAYWYAYSIDQGGELTRLRLRQLESKLSAKQIAHAKQIGQSLSR